MNTNHHPISTPTISTPTISTPTISTPTISTPTISTDAIGESAEEPRVAVPLSTLCSVVAILETVRDYSARSPHAAGLARGFGPDVHRCEIESWTDALAGSLSRLLAAAAPIPQHQP